MNKTYTVIVDNGNGVAGNGEIKLNMEKDEIVELAKTERLSVFDPIYNMIVWDNSPFIEYPENYQW